MTEEYEVTGITYLIGCGLPREEATKAANEYIKSLKVGTPLILAAEPTNMHDENAIAVYANHTHHIGYVKATSCLEVKTLLDEDGQCEAFVSGNDGWVTLFINIPNAPDEIKSEKRGRVLPPNPLEAVLKTQFSEKERALEVVAKKLSRMKPTAESIATYLEMLKSYMPLAELSICYEDNYWRDQILRHLRAACKRNFDSEQKAELERLRDELSDIEANQTRSNDHPKLKLMKKQLEQLRANANSGDGLFVNFEFHIATSGRSVKDEIECLEQWFKHMPRLKIRDYHHIDLVAEGLNYLRISRKELYEVCAALLILNRYANKNDKQNQDFTDIKEYIGRVKPLLSAGWTEQRFDDLWAAVLSLPAVSAIAKNKGKQQNTTFNRNLIANILHTMVNQEVFSPKATNQAMAEALEGTKDHSVRDAVGRALEDKVMKAAIEKLIEEMK